MRARGLVFALGGGISSIALTAEDCISAATTEMEINLSSGVYTERAAVSSPLKIRVPTGINHAAYGACLRIQGNHISKHMTATVARMGKCRNSTRSTHIVQTDGAMSAHIANVVDHSRYQACVDHGIDVEVLLPAAVTH